MSYTPTNWKTGDIVSSEKLNKMEEGIANAHSEEYIVAETDEWLEENITQETGYVLDRSLQSANAAAPADIVGDIQEDVSDAKNAIDQLESEVVTDVTVTGTVVTIVAQANKRYLCGTVSTIDVTPCATGAFDLIFTSGTTAAVLTIPNTVKWQDSSFDPSALDTDTIYEISVADGTLGLVASWT